MDIRLPLTGLTQATLNKLVNQPVTLKVGQQIDAQVLGTELQAGKVAVTLKLGNDTVTLQSNQAIPLAPGQNLQLQVVKLAPVPEFRIVNSQPSTNPQILIGSIPVAAKPFSDIPVTPPPTNTASTPVFNQPNPQQDLPGKQILEFKIIGFSGDKVQLQLIPSTVNPSAITPTTVSTSNKATVIVVDRSQLQPLPSSQSGSPSAVPANTTAKSPPLASTEALKIGQHLALEITTTSTGIEFKIAPHTTNKVLEQQITSLVKQFLPKHESSPVLLNQLLKDLPQLLANKQLPETLKTVAITLLENLPGKEQLLVSTGLKQAINNSGLLLEPKLAMAIEHQELDLKLDFKANLLKLVHLLKQEILPQNQANPELQDLDLLKNLQQKTENTLAKIALEQLQAFPKEESAKQVWNVEIPFLNNGGAEAMDIQIQWEKNQAKQSQHSPDWSVQITVSPPNLGTIHCTIAYQNKVISTYFKSQQNQTTALITQHLDDLKKQLEASGLTTGHLVSQQGSMKAKPSHSLLANNLFDEQA